jgi:hypothetical protein
MDRVDDKVFDLRKPVACPWCRHVLHVAGNACGESKKMRPGDVCLCVECGKFSFQVGTSSLRKATWEEFQELITDPLMLVAWLAWKTEYKRDHGRS